MIVCAKYLLDGELTALDHGAIEIVDGRIREIGSARDAGGGAVVDCGDSVLLPGLVNAHTHLELGFCAGKVPPRADFTAWLRRLMDCLREASADDKLGEASVAAGLETCVRAGTTLVGDVTRHPRRSRAIAGRHVRRPTVVSFGEVIAVGAQRAAGKERLASAVDDSQRSETLRMGVSPHATYSVEPAALHACVAAAKKHGLPLCIHAAEAREERDYTMRAAGPLRAFLEELGLWDEDVPTLGQPPIEYLARAGALGASTVLAHANYATDEDIELLQRTRTSVAYCPRTHRAFGHDPHPFRKMIAAGVNVCLGTDSLASNPSLSLLDEMRFLRREHDDAGARTILRMGTAAGACALGFGEVTGVLCGRRRADLIAVPLDPGGPADPLENILRSDCAPSACFVGGRQLVPDV